jgi:hypothetical protein
VAVEHVARAAVAPLHGETTAASQTAGESLPEMSGGLGFGEPDVAKRSRAHVALDEGHPSELSSNAVVGDAPIRAASARPSDAEKRPAESEPTYLALQVPSEPASQVVSGLLARQLLDTREVRSRTSPALDIALRLHDAQTCEEFLPLIGRAARIGDERALRKLMALTDRVGCGERGSDDCFACLRPGRVLLKSIAALRRRLDGSASRENAQRTQIESPPSPSQE